MQPWHLSWQKIVAIYGKIPKVPQIPMHNIHRHPEGLPPAAAAGRFFARRPIESMETVLNGASSEGSCPGAEIAELHDERTSLDYAFERDETRAKHRLEECRTATREAFVNIAGISLTDEHRELIRARSHYVLPAFNEGENVGTVLRYLREEHGVSPESITLLDCSTDPEDRTVDVAKNFGVEAVPQERVLADLLDTGRFLDLLQAEKIPRGKGLTLTAAYLHLVAEGIVNEHCQCDHVVCLDSDPQDYGIGKYDPVGAFAILRNKYDAESMKPAKAKRNNQPVYVGENSLGIMGAHAKDILDYVGRMEWRLSGEMSRSAMLIPQLVMSTGYPVETLMNMSDAELGARFVQYADGPLRSDGENSYEKETVMYTQIIRSRLAIELWNMANIVAQQHKVHAHERPSEVVQALLTRRHKNAVDYDVADVRGVNSILARDIFEYVPDETHIPPRGVDVKDIVESRVIGSVAMLIREGIAKIPA